MSEIVTREMLVDSVEKGEALVEKWRGIREDWVRMRDESLNRIVESDVALESALMMHKQALMMLMDYDDEIMMGEV